MVVWAAVLDWRNCFSLGAGYWPVVADLLFHSPDGWCRLLPSNEPTGLLAAFDVERDDICGSGGAQRSPPDTKRSSPVIQAESVDARKTTAGSRVKTFSYQGGCV